MFLFFYLQGELTGHGMQWVVVVVAAAAVVVKFDLAQVDIYYWLCANAPAHTLNLHTQVGYPPQDMV